MNPSRVGGSWIRSPAFSLALILFLLAVLAVGDKPEPTLLWNALFDAGHAPLFGAIALATRQLLRCWRPGVNGLTRAASAFLVTVAIGVATEYLQQGNPHRDASVNDVLRDAAGASAFLLLAEARGGDNPFRGSQRRVTRIAAVVSAVGLLVAAMAQLAVTAVVLVERARSFPVLVRFDGTWWEDRMIDTGYNTLTPGAYTAVSASGTIRLARLDLIPGTYSGLIIGEPYPDWDGYSRLVLHIVSDLDAPIAITIRIHDAIHDQRYEDRFNRELQVMPGANRLIIALRDIRSAPDRRKMDMSRIRGIVLFAYRLDRPTHLNLGRIELE
jgi:hypothetical protein